MRTKVVYTLTSSEKDIYLEQALISAYSCRLHNPDAEILLIIDPATNENLVGKRAEIDKYITKRIVIDCPNEFSQVARSRFLKTMVRQSIDGDFIFIDTDTVITDSLEAADDFEGSIGVVPEFHCTLEHYPGTKGLKEDAKRDGWEYDSTDIYNYNSGVIICKDDEEGNKFYQMWHECWRERLQNRGGHHDQPPMAKADHLLNHPIKVLDGIWNCQIIMNGIYFLPKAKIVHYYGSSLLTNKRTFSYAFEDASILYEIKELGYIPPNTVEMILRAKELINSRSQIVVADEIDIVNSQIYRVIKNLFFHHLGVFKFVNQLFLFGGNLKNKWMKPHL